MNVQKLLTKPILIIVGKSASGKDTLQKYLQETYNTTSFVSVTTRPMRDGEKEGIHYFYRDKNEFSRLVEKGDIFEYRSYDTLVNNVPDTWYYGSIKQELKPGTHYTVVVDIDGALAYIKAYGAKNCSMVYIECPDKTREKRARKRGSFDKKEWDRRVADDNEKFSKERLALIGGALGQTEYIKIVNSGADIEDADMQVKKYFSKQWQEFCLHHYCRICSYNKEGKCTRDNEI